MLKELALLVTLLTLLADARPQRFEVCDHWGHIIHHWDDFMQEPLNDQDEMSEEVDGPQRFENGDLLNNNDDIREKSGGLTFQVRMNDPRVCASCNLYSSLSPCMKLLGVGRKLSIILHFPLHLTVPAFSLPITN